MPAATGIRAGRAFVELFADDSKLVRGLRGAQRKLQAFGRTLRSAGTRVFAAGAAMTGGFALATRVFMAFDDQMRTVKAVTGASAEQFQMLTETAKGTPAKNRAGQTSPAAPASPAASRPTQNAEARR